MAQDDLKIAELSQVTLPPAVTMALVLVTPVVYCRDHPITSRALIRCESFTFDRFCNTISDYDKNYSSFHHSVFVFVLYVYLHACLFYTKYYQMYQD